MVHPDDLARVQALLGRIPAADFDIVVRDGAGDPVVIRNAALLHDGTPMPTRYWLIGKHASARVARLESLGAVDEAERAIDPTAIAAAHRRYAVERDGTIDPQWAGPRPSGGVAGTRVGVKCLHAHYAWWLVGGDDPVGAWVASRLEHADNDARTTPHTSNTTNATAPPAAGARS